MGGEYSLAEKLPTELNPRRIWHLRFDNVHYDPEPSGSAYRNLYQHRSLPPDQEKAVRIHLGEDGILTEENRKKTKPAPKQRGT